MEKTVSFTNFDFPHQKNTYKGKVRDVYNIDDKFLIIITTDRISAFDKILPVCIPYKGQILNQIASKFLDATEDIVPNWKIATIDPMVTFGRICKPFKVEMVVRAYLAGHSWREYKKGERKLCGIDMPDGMKENEKFPEPIITPTTKEDNYHDKDISKEDIINKGLINRKEYELLENYTKALFKRGTEIAERKGLILVDTKYEFGKADDKIFLIDEIHTPDSSRYFYKEQYEERLKNNLPQKQLSKEFVRKWLMEKGFYGEKGQEIPKMDNAFINQVSERYIKLYEILTDERFVKSDTSNILIRIENNIMDFLNAYKSR